MPKMDGLQLWCFVHDSSVKKKYLFYVVSVGKKITEDAFSLGAYYYVLKPFDKQDALKSIKHEK